MPELDGVMTEATPAVLAATVGYGVSEKETPPAPAAEPHEFKSGLGMSATGQVVGRA